MQIENAVNALFNPSRSARWKFHSCRSILSRKRLEKRIERREDRRRFVMRVHDHKLLWGNLILNGVKGK